MKGAVEKTAAPFVPKTTSVRVLSAAAHACRGCDLYKTATQVVFGAGPRTARVMFVGEQPATRKIARASRSWDPPARCCRRRSRRSCAR